MGCRPESGSFLSPIDQDMLSSVGVESSANVGSIFLSRGLAVLDFCENKYKEAELKVSGLTEKMAKWKHYARSVYKVERPYFLDSSLVFAATARANHQLTALFDDLFAKLVETRLIREQICEHYWSTLKDRDALAGAIKELVRQK